MNNDFVITLTNRIPRVLSGISVFSQFTSETALSIENFNALLSDWRQRAEAMEQQTAYLIDVEWIMEHRADEVFQTAHELKVTQFELLRELIQTIQKRAGLLDMMSIDLQAAETDAAKKLETAKSKAERDLSKILPNTGPREKVLFQQAINSSEIVQAAAGKLREVRGLLSSTVEMKRPLDDNHEKLCELLQDAAHALTK